MNTYQADIMAAQEQIFRADFGTSVTYDTVNFSVTTAQIADRKSGAEIFSHIGLDAYEFAPDVRVFEFNAVDLAPTTGIAVPAPGSSIVWQGKQYTSVFSVPAVISDVVQTQRVYAYYAGPVVSVAVLRESVSAKSGTGYTRTDGAIAGSPFNARIYRLRSNAFDFYQPPEGITTIEHLIVVAFPVSAPALEINDVCVLPDGSRGRILRLRPYPDRLDADLELGTV